MKKVHYLYVALFLIVVIVLAEVLESAEKQFVKDYEKPDTTITIHNGKPDTIIVKKQLPSWLR